MLRGVLLGFFWGAVVSALGLAFLSLNGPPPSPSGQTPSSVDVAVPAGSEFNRNRPETRPVIPGGEAGGETADAPQVASTETESAPIADTASADVPASETQALDGLASPETDGTTSNLNFGSGDGAGGGDSATPSISAGATDTEEIPQVPEQPDPAVAPAEVVAEQPTQPVTDTETPLTPSLQLPVASEEPAEGNEVATAQPVPSDSETATVDTETAQAPEVEETAEEMANPDPAEESESPDAQQDVAVLRLPTIESDEPETPAETPEAPEAAETEAAEDVTLGLGALARNSRPFTNDEGKPLMSIVLIDVGEEGLDRSGLMTFPFPVTIAVDGTRADAAQAAADYRSAGLEVIVMAPSLPEGTTPDTIVNHIETMLQAVPQAIGLVDAAQGGFQGNRRLIDPVIETLAVGGHGLLTYDRGLNTAQQMAESEGLPAGTIFRTLDAEREGTVTINRYLDRAKLRAGQEGEVVMIGHSYTDTVTALFTWMMDSRASEVALAPLSAILRN